MPTTVFTQRLHYQGQLARAFFLISGVLITIISPFQQSVTDPLSIVRIDSWFSILVCVILAGMITSRWNKSFLAGIFFGLAFIPLFQLAANSNFGLVNIGSQYLFLGITDEIITLSLFFSVYYCFRSYRQTKEEIISTGDGK